MSQTAVGMSPLWRFTQEKLLLRGRVLSHLIGFSLFVYLFLDRIWLFDLPFTKYIDIPIRILALWLLLDRTGRKGRVSIGPWDYLYGCFIAAYGLALIFADAYMIRFGGFQNYLAWILDIASPLFFFLVVREASTRIGFSYQIILGWVIGILTAAALLGLAQALDILGLRSFSSELWHWEFFEKQMLGPSAAYQAKGPTPHANSMAFYMVLGLAFMPAFLRYPKLRPWAIGSVGLFFMCTFASYSRTGMLGLFGVLFAFALFYLIRKNYRVALSIGLSMITLFTLAVALIYAFDVERFKVALEGEGKVANTKSERGGFRIRAEAMKKSVTLGSNFPVFGVAATSAGLQNLKMITKNAYSFGTILTGLYTYTFVMYGFVGVLFVCGVLFVFFSYLWRKDVPESFAATAFAVGTAVAVFGIAENSLFLSYATGLIHLCAAMVMSAKLRSVRKIEPVETGLAKAA